MKWIQKISSRQTEPTPEEMVKYLLDKTVEYGDRDDIAMYLAQYDLPEVEAALIQVATGHAEDKGIIDSVGESLWEIWQRQSKDSHADVVEKRHPSAKKFFNNNNAYQSLNLTG